MDIFQSLSSKKILPSLVAFGLIFCLGCEKNTNDSIDSILSKTMEVSDAALEQVGNLSSNDAKKEFKKLNQYEYKVISFKKESSISELEGSLSIYGANGYDCSGPLARAEDLILICKRRPDSLLRYVPQTLVGRP